MNKASEKCGTPLSTAKIYNNGSIRGRGGKEQKKIFRETAENFQT